MRRVRRTLDRVSDVWQSREAVLAIADSKRQASVQATSRAECGWRAGRQRCAEAERYNRVCMSGVC